MHLPRRPASSLVFAAALAPALVSGLALDLCANFNTASTGRNTSNLQSNGLCHDFCMGDYAFSITQDFACWCSNYAPAKSVQEDLGDCNTPCPSYPMEQCGGEDLFGYIELDENLIEGTRGSGSSPTSDSAATTSESPEVTKTVQTTVTYSPTSTSTSVESSTSSDSSKPAATSQVRTVTADGTIKTVTVLPTETAGSSSGDTTGISDDKDDGLSKGAIAGIVVGVIAAVLIVVGAAIYFVFKRRRERQNEGYHDDPSIRGSSPGTGSNQPNMSMSDGAPASPNTTSNRNSTLQIDPRMDPFKQGLYARNPSNESVNTLQDNHDYSRRILRATNPDPDQ